MCAHKVHTSGYRFSYIRQASLIRTRILIILSVFCSSWLAEFFANLKRVFTFMQLDSRILFNKKRLQLCSFFIEKMCFEKTALRKLLAKFTEFNKLRIQCRKKSTNWETYIFYESALDSRTSWNNAFLSQLWYWQWYKSMIDQTL